MAPDLPPSGEARRDGRAGVLLVSARPMTETVRAIRDRGFVVLGPVDVSTLPARPEPDAAVAIFDLRNGDVPRTAMMQLCQKIGAPVIVITEPDDAESRISALHAGVADHVIAPYDTRELMARIEMLIARRRRARRSLAIVQIGDVTVDNERRQASRGSHRVTLTSTEHTMLMELARNAEHAVSKQMLSDAVWPGQPHSDNAVEVHVSALRRKLKSIGSEPIHTIHGAGYVLKRAPEPKQLSRAALIAERDRLLQERDDALARRDALLQTLRRITVRRG